MLQCLDYEVLIQFPQVLRLKTGFARFQGESTIHIVDTVPVGHLIANALDFPNMLADFIHFPIFNLQSFKSRQ